MKRVIFLTLAILGLVSAATAIGLTLTPYVAKKLGYRPYIFGHLVERGADSVPALIEVIGHSRSSIVLGADFINNKSVLEALEKAGTKRVSVAVVLSGAQALNNSNPPAGARAWLIQHQIPVYVSTMPIRGFMLVSDRSTAIVCTSPILSSDQMKTEDVPILIFAHDQTAATCFALIRSWLPTYNGSP